MRKFRLNPTATALDTRQFWVPVRWASDLGTFAVYPYCHRACRLDAPETRCLHWVGETRTHEESGEPTEVLFADATQVAPIARTVAVQQSRRAHAPLDQRVDGWITHTEKVV